MKTKIEELSNEIVNYFMQKCNATISKKDYDYIINTITMHLIDEAKQEIN